MSRPARVARVRWGYQASQEYARETTHFPWRCGHCVIRKWILAGTKTLDAASNTCLAASIRVDAELSLGPRQSPHNRPDRLICRQLALLSRRPFGRIYTLADIDVRWSELIGRGSAHVQESNEFLPCSRQQPSWSGQGRAPSLPARV